MRPGEYSIRGGLIDLFPMGSNLPYRLDLFGDEIEQIRSFDPDTQRSLYPVKEVRLLPGHEFPFDDEARTAFRGRWREVFEGDPTRCSIYKDANLGIPSAGIESYLPMFFKEQSCVFDYFPRSGDPVWIVSTGDIDETIRSFWKDTLTRYEFLKHDLDRPILPPKELFLDVDEFFSISKPHARLVLEKETSQTVQVKEKRQSQASTLSKEPLIFRIAVSAFTATKDDELSFESGQLIRVLKQESNGWCEGYYGKDVGWFPFAGYTDEFTGDVTELEESWVVFTVI